MNDSCPKGIKGIHIAAFFIAATALFLVTGCSLNSGEPLKTASDGCYLFRDTADDFEVHLPKRFQRLQKKSVKWDTKYRRIKTKANFYISAQSEGVTLQIRVADLGKDAPEDREKGSKHVYRRDALYSINNAFFTASPLIDSRANAMFDVLCLPALTHTWKQAGSFNESMFIFHGTKLYEVNMSAKNGSELYKKMDNPGIRPRVDKDSGTRDFLHIPDDELLHFFKTFTILSNESAEKDSHKEAEDSSEEKHCSFDSGTNADKVTQPNPWIKPVVKFDGVYKTVESDGSWSFLRFYKDGTVITTNSSIPHTKGLDRRFNKDDEIFSYRGKYSISGSKIEFHIEYKSGTVDFEGRIDGNFLKLSIFSHINNKNFCRVFDFIPIEFEK